MGQVGNNLSVDYHYLTFTPLGAHFAYLADIFFAVLPDSFTVFTFEPDKRLRRALFVSLPPFKVRDFSFGHDLKTPLPTFDTFLPMTGAAL